MTNKGTPKSRKEKARKDKNENLADLLHCRKKFLLMQSRPSKRQCDVLDLLAELNSEVYRGILLKEQFLSVYRSDTRQTASAGLSRWITATFRSGIPAELVEKFYHNRHFILNYFILRITTAISERISNKIKRLKRMAYGWLQGRRLFSPQDPSTLRVA